jgi:hypothetical protein
MKILKTKVKMFKMSKTNKIFKISKLTNKKKEDEKEQMRMAEIFLAHVENLISAIQLYTLISKQNILRMKK